MDTNEWLDLIHHLTGRCNQLEQELAQIKNLRSRDQASIESLVESVQALSPGSDAGSLLLQEDKSGHIDGHVVVAVSGSARYLGEPETGFPEQLTLARYHNADSRADYYHETIVKTLQNDLAIARHSAETLKSALHDRF